METYGNVILEAFASGLPVLTVNQGGVKETLTSSLKEAIEGTEAILLLTEWKEFREANWESLRKWVSHPLLIDGRNCLDEEKMRKAGFDYVRIGKQPMLSLKPVRAPHGWKDGRRETPVSQQ